MLSDTSYHPTVLHVIRYFISPDSASYHPILHIIRYSLLSENSIQASNDLSESLGQAMLHVIENSFQTLPNVIREINPNQYYFMLSYQLLFLIICE